MSGALPSFQCAADLGPSPSREAELEDICSRLAAENEQLRDATEQPAQQARPTPAGIKPEERQVLIQLLSDLREQAKEHSRDIERLQKENADLKKSVAEAQQDIAWVQENFPKLIAEDRRRLAAVEGQAISTLPQKKQVRQGEVLIALLVANGGKMLAIDARHKLGISKPAFSLLLRTVSDKIELKHFHLDRRKNVIILKS